MVTYNGSLLVSIPSNINVNISDGFVIARSEKSNILRKYLISGCVSLYSSESDSALVIKSNKKAEMFTCAAHLRRLFLEVVSGGVVRSILLKGVGFKAFIASGNFLCISSGYSHLVAMQIPEKIIVAIKDQGRIELSGFVADVSRFSASLTGIRNWDACSQKGIIRDGDVLRVKKAKKK